MLYPLSYEGGGTPSRRTVTCVRSKASRADECDRSPTYAQALTGPESPDDADVFGDVLPDTTEDERGPAPGERDRDDDDERILRERPPHW